MINPKVSILIPLYNSEKYISETIQSALSQTWENKEIIIVDDGSTDNSYSIAKSFESTILKVYKQNNQGACVARNFAFEKSTGDYIQYLDADDLLSANKVSEQLGLLEKKNYDSETIATCNFQRLVNGELKVARENLEYVNKDYSDPLDLLRDLWLYSIPSYVPIAYLTPRNLILQARKWDVSLLKNQDGEFFSRVLNNAHQVVFTENTSVVWRYVPNSISSTHSALKAHSIYNSYVSISNILLQKKQDKLINKAIGVAFGHLLFYDGNIDIYRLVKKKFKSYSFPIIYPDKRITFRYFCLFMDCYKAKELTDRLWRLRNTLIKFKQLFKK